MGRAATREVGACAAEIGHEERVADETGIANDVSHASRRMARGRDDARHDLPYLEGLAVGEQVVELAAVSGEVLEVENAFERLLHGRHTRTDGRLAAELLAQVGSTGQMIGMYVGLEDPVDAEPVVPYVRDDFISRCRGCPACIGIVVEDRVHDGGPARRRIADHVRDREGIGVVESFYVWLAHRYMINL